MVIGILYILTLCVQYSCIFNTYHIDMLRNIRLLFSPNFIVSVLIVNHKKLIQFSQTSCVLIMHVHRMLF